MLSSAMARRLDHAEGTSKPLRTAPSHSRVALRSAATGQSTSRRPLRGSSPLLNTKRCMTSASGICDKSATGRCTSFPNGRNFVPLASAIKEHTLTHLDEYLDEFESQREIERNPRALGTRRSGAQQDRARYPARPRCEVADQKQVDADRRVRLPTLHGFRRHRGDRNRSRRAHSAA